MKLFRKESLAKVTSLENLDKLLTVVSIKGWLILLFFSGLFAAVIFWAFVGNIPISASGRAILMDPKHSYVLRSQAEGVVKEVRFIGGESVRKGDVIVEMQNDPLRRKIQERKKYIASLEREISADRDQGTVRSRQRELLLAEEELKDLEEEAAGLVVTAPTDGKLTWVDLNVGDQVGYNDILVTMQGIPSIESVKIFAFIPLGPGQLIKPGMKAKCALNTIDSEKYGMILGKVQQVMPYPISPEEYYMQKIPSKPLRQYLVGNALSNVLVIIDPVEDPTTYSGLAWTSGKGPEMKVIPPLLGSARVTLEEVRPISYILPLIEN